MKVAIGREYLYLALSNAPHGSEIDSIRLTRQGRGLEICWHMPNDPVACGEIHLSSGKDRASS